MGLFSGIGKALGSITGTVGGLLNNITGVSDTAKKSYNDQVNLWNMQNQYNTPSAQIARMADAGIDINPMTYAVGNGSMDTKASSIGSPSYSGSGINPIATAMSVVQGIKGMQVQNAEMQRMGKEVERMDSDIVNKDLETKILKHNLNLARHLNMPVGQTPLLHGQFNAVKELWETAPEYIGQEAVKLLKLPFQLYNTGTSYIWDKGKQFFNKFKKK